MGDLFELLVDIGFVQPDLALPPAPSTAAAGGATPAAGKGDESGKGSGKGGGKGGGGKGGKGARESEITGARRSDHATALLRRLKARRPLGGEHYNVRASPAALQPWSPFQSLTMV